MKVQVDDQQRIVQADGGCNIRDLGGYRAADGGMTRWGVLYRSAGLHRLTAEGRAALAARGIRTVIDLRHARETEAKPNVFAGGADGVDYVRISLLNPAGAGAASETIRSLGELYIAMLDRAGEPIRLAFERIADAEGHAVLFHCAAGKDRTGVVAALLLALAGVPHAAIAEDYAMTGACIAPIMDELREGRPETVTAEQYEIVLGSEPADMLAMLRHLDDQYGGAAAYLRGIGLSEARIEALRERLVQQD